MQNFANTGTIPNKYGTAPVRGKVWRKKNKNLLHALRFELAETIPAIIRENRAKMGHLRPGTDAHNACKSAIQTAIARRAWLHMVL